MAQYCSNIRCIVCNNHIPICNIELYKKGDMKLYNKEVELDN